MPQLNNIPPHLAEYISGQNYDLYSAIDQATWRFIMRISRDFFKDHAHPKYVSGLEQTGITIERIPRISEMDEKLKKLGWRAVTVTGFIPPAIFLEFQSLSILPIACDMRNLEHLDYTPSPDIVHEAAGHAPIIADPKYASYLHKFGEIARKAIFAKEDLEVYEAIKFLSDIKEDPKTTEAEVEAAYKRLDEAYSRVQYVSEATQLSRLGWWSTEYGLVRAKKVNAKSGEDPYEYKIYGAGLLSSVGESYNAIMGEVKKVPLTIECANVNFDITKPQPQLFYVDDFKELEVVIEQLAHTMAFKLGGAKALEVARRAQTVTTTELETGLQISGVLTKVRTANDNKDSIIYLQYSGPVQLSYEDQELPGHSAKYHEHGFGTPLGRIRGLGKTAGELTQGELNSLAGRLEFESGVVVEGELVSSLRKNGKNVVLTFKNCRVSLSNETLFDPSWGTFDMACGEEVVSVYGGAADRVAYLKAVNQFSAQVKGQTSNLTERNRDLDKLYLIVREIRERGVQTADLPRLIEISEAINQNYMKDWLLRFEIYELLLDKVWDADTRATRLRSQIQEELDLLARESKVVGTLIARGLRLPESTARQ